MKRVFAMILAAALVFGLAACGSGEEAPKSIDLAAVYATMEQTLPDMMVLDDPDTMLNFFGIKAEDCVQVITAVSADGLRTDEVWLIEAKDAAAVEYLKQMASSRLAAKEEEAAVYSPEQFAIVQNAELIVQGNYLALLVSPDVEILKTVFTDAAM